MTPPNSPPIPGDPLDALIKNWRSTISAEQVVMGVYHFCADELESALAAHDALVSRRARLEALRQAAQKAHDAGVAAMNEKLPMRERNRRRDSFLAIAKAIRALADHESGNGLAAHDAALVSATLGLCSAKLRKVSKTCGEGGHTQREKMFNAIATNIEQVTIADVVAWQVAHERKG